MLTEEREIEGISHCIARCASFLRDRLLLENVEGGNRVRR